MMKKALFLFIFLTGTAYGAYSPSTIITDPAGVNQATVKAASTAATATDKALVVALSPNNTCAVTGTFWQSTQPVSSTQLPSALDGSGYFKVHEQGTANVSVQNASLAVTQSGTWNVGISAGSNTIGSVKLTDGTNTATIKAASTAPAATDTAQVVAISPNTPAVATKSPVNTNGVFAQLSAGATSSNYTAPTNAVAFVLQGDSTNTDCIRWSLGGVPSATFGMVAQPGQDTGEIKAATTIFFIACSGSQKVNIQWILSQ